MAYLPIIIAFGIILLMGYWSGNRRAKSEINKKPKVAEIYPLSKSKRHTKLRRIK